MVYHLFHYQKENVTKWPGPYLPKTPHEGTWVNKPFHGTKWSVPRPLRSFFARTDVTLVGYKIDTIITRLQQVCGEKQLTSFPNTIDITRLRTMSEYDQVGKNAGMHSHTVTVTLTLIHYFYTHRSCLLDPTRDWVEAAIQEKQECEIQFVRLSGKGPNQKRRLDRHCLLRVRYILYWHHCLHQSSHIHVSLPRQLHTHLQQDHYVRNA